MGCPSRVSVKPNKPPEPDGSCGHSGELIQKTLVLNHKLTSTRKLYGNYVYLSLVSA